jgi:tetratricopeptide (TPR) repeat protein
VVRYDRIVLLAGAALSANPAFAADALKFGPPPAWVHLQTVPAAKPSEAPVALLLNDRQISFERGKITVFAEAAVKIENSQGLAAGNVNLTWQPATDTLTVNKLQIRRGDKIIDVLASGQTFTTLRRETNLDAATLDGTLTATLQPEGLQVGDIIDIETTTERSDPVLKGHVEAMFGTWGILPIEAAHAALSWPAGMHLQFRQTPNLPVARKTSAGGINHLELAGQDVQPLIAPKGAPERFTIGRLAEATDYSSWSDLATLFVPLFRDASVIPASGPLHDEVEKIRAASTNPKTRAEQALALVQDRVRYVALLMGQGGYVPAAAETTWSRRFGDCKAKTALLLGILHSLGIEADPVLVQASAGDMIADRLPMISLFNHVLVRAHIGGKDYWLDGTRTGDTDLDSIQVPDFGWGLPLVEHAQLVRMVPAPLTVPSLERHVAIDASSGIYAPATITIDEIYRGDDAVSLNPSYAALTPEQRDQQMSDEAKGFFDGFSVSGSSVQFDPAKRELHISIKGSARLNWKDGWFFVPTSSISFDPDFDRPAGPLHDVPIAVSHPRYTKDEATIRLPAGFAAQQKLDPAVHETLAGVEYARSETVSGDVLTVDSSERSIATEVPYKDAVAAAPRLKALDKDDIYLGVVKQYRSTNADLAALAKDTPGSANEFLRRAGIFLDAGKMDQAIADFTQVLSAEPGNVVALAGRGYAYVWKHQFDKSGADLSAAAAIEPSNAAVLSAQGLQAEFQNKFAEAIAYYSRALQSDPNNGFMRGHRAICERSLNQNDAALADSEFALKTTPTWLDLRVLRANIFRGAGKRDLVAAEADAMTKDNPNSAYAWVGAAKTYAALGQRDRAMKAFDRALAIKPEAYIYVNRSEVRAKSDIAGRMADLDAALKLAPNEPTALQDKARLLSDTGDQKGALALLEQVKIEPSTDEFYALYIAETRAILLYKAGRTAEAEKLLADLSSKAKSPLELNNLCYDQATAGIRLDAALEDCRAALKVSPDDGAYLDSLGMVLLKIGKLDEALSAYNRAVAKGEGAASLMGRAFVYLKKGDRTHAEADADAARKLSPDIDETFAEYGLKFDRATVSATAPPSATKH